MIGKMERGEWKAESELEKWKRQNESKEKGRGGHGIGHWKRDSENGKRERGK